MVSTMSVLQELDKVRKLVAKFADMREPEAPENNDMEVLAQTVEEAAAKLAKYAVRWFEGVIAQAMTKIRNGEGDKRKMESLIRVQVTSIKGKRWGVDPLNIHQTLYKAAEAS